MNLFNKNPFVNKNTNTKIVGNNFHFNDNQKIENIKEKMVNLKFQNQNLNKSNKEQKLNENKQSDLQQKIDFLRNLNK